jgi:hypothetical protein
MEVLLITGPLSKAARALVEVSRAKVAANANLDEAAIRAFEHGMHTPPDSVIQAIQDALEELGAVFIPEQGALGAGVRLKFNRSLTKRIGNLENEGGPSAKDDVP